MTEMAPFRLAPLGRRGFLAALIGTGFWPLIGSGRLAAAVQGGPPADVRLFGAAGNGVANDTLAFRRARRASATIYAPAGTYLVDTVLLPAGTTLITDGAATRFKQRRGIRERLQILTVTGSNVVIGDCTVEGNIATDDGEWRHGVVVQASPETGPISNVRVGNINGRNLRGDVVYIGSNGQVPVTGVQVGNVNAANIIRNVVSVVGGRNISIGHITGTNVGYTHLDIEPDEWNAPVNGCTVASVRGSFVQIAGQTASSAVDGVRIGLLDLRQGTDRSIPPYPPGLKRTNALELRNFRSVEIDQLIARGFTGAAIVQIWNPGALPDQYIHIGQAELTDCCRGPGRNAYIQGSRRATHLRIDSLAANISKRGVDVVRDCKSARILRVTGNRPQTSRLIALASPVEPHMALAAAGAGTTAAIVGIARHRWR
jgi:hypothetical protein